MTDQTSLMGEHSFAETPDDVLAAALYPSMQSTPAAAAAAPVQPEQKQQGPREQRSDEEMAATLYPNMCNEAVRTIEAAALEDLSTPEEAKQIADIWASHFRALQLSSSEASMLAELRISAQRSPPDDTKAEQWVGEAKAALVGAYGRQNVGQLLVDAKKLIAKHPALANYLAQSGLGNHPKVVQLAVAKARNLKARGKL